MPEDQRRGDDDSDASSNDGGRAMDEEVVPEEWPHDDDDNNKSSISNDGGPGGSQAMDEDASDEASGYQDRGAPYLSGEDEEDNIEGYDADRQTAAHADVESEDNGTDDGAESDYHNDHKSQVSCQEAKDC